MSANALSTQSHDLSSNRRREKGTLSVGGPVVALITGGFTINAGASVGYLHVYVTPSTTIDGPAIAVGQLAQVTGTGSASTSVTATSIVTTAVGASPSPIPMQTNKVTLGGSISSTFTNGFTIYAGSSVGYLHVYTSSATAFSGGTPKAGSFAEVTGTGSASTSLTATYVGLTASAPATVVSSGTVSASAPYGFTENAGSSYLSVPIVLNGTTIVGGATLAPGARVTVTGVGSQSSSIVAAQIVVTAASPPPGTATPTPAPIAAKHVLTGDYLGAPYGTTSVAWSTAAQYLTWAQVSMQNSAAVAAAGMKTQLYLDPNRSQAGVGDPFYSSDESTYAHDCSGNRVTDTYAGNITQYVMNPASPTLQAAFVAKIAQEQAYGHYDAIFEDDAGPLSEYVYTPFSAMPCSYSDAMWLTSGTALDQTATAPVMINGIEALNGQQPSQTLGLVSSSQVMGANFEHCYSDDSQPKMTGWLWQAIENSALIVNGQHKAFECMLRNSSAAASSVDARIYSYASFLLTYNPSTSIYWEEFATASGLHVFPEEQLIALNPVTTPGAQVSSLAAAGGTYGQQYGACYIAGKFVGSCAVVVNPDSQSAHPFPYPQYRHSLVLAGGGVLDGGTISTTGAAPPVNLAASEAAIVFP